MILLAFYLKKKPTNFDMINLVMDETPIYSPIAVSVAVGGTIGACILLIIGVVIAALVFR